MENDFEITTGAELGKLPEGWKPRAVSLSEAKVPEPLRHLIPAAERLGISDDILRERLLREVPRQELELLAAELEKVERTLDEWLSGPEADSETPSREYIAFSALRMLILS